MPINTKHETIIAEKEMQRKHFCQLVGLPENQAHLVKERGVLTDDGKRVKVLESIDVFIYTNVFKKIDWQGIKSKIELDFLARNISVDKNLKTKKKNPKIKSCKNKVISTTKKVKTAKDSLDFSNYWHTELNTILEYSIKGSETLDKMEEILSDQLNKINLTPNQSLQLSEMQRNIEKTKYEKQKVVPKETVIFCTGVICEHIMRSCESLLSKTLRKKGVPEQEIEKLEKEFYNLVTSSSNGLKIIIQEFLNEK